MASGLSILKVISKAHVKDLQSHHQTVQRETVCGTKKIDVTDNYSLVSFFFPKPSMLMKK